MNKLFRHLLLLAAAAALSGAWAQDVDCKAADASARLAYDNLRAALEKKDNAATRKSLVEFWTIQERAPRCPGVALLASQLTAAALPRPKPNPVIVMPCKPGEWGCRFFSEGDNNWSGGEGMIR